MIATLPICRYRTEASETHARCRSAWVKAPAAGVPLSFCQRCPYADRSGCPEELLPTYACQHRGAVIEIAETPGCGCGKPQTEVYACALHGACTLHKVMDKRGRSWQSCLGCLAEEEDR